MGRIVHFEIHVDDMERDKKFYGDVFGWTFEDWTQYAGLLGSRSINGSTELPVYLSNVFR